MYIYDTESALAVKAFSGCMCVREREELQMYISEHCVVKGYRMCFVIGYRGVTIKPQLGN